MDTNLSLALKMAGGILIALIIISAVTLLFNNINPSQQQLEDIKALEQTADFNKEYEVYNKSLMYGVDVISVLNKAASNNKAYLEENNGYSEDLRNNYLIDIIFEDNIELEQTIDIYRIVNDGYHVREESFNISDIPNRLTGTARTEIIGKLGIAEAEFEDSNTQNLFRAGIDNRCLIIDEGNGDCINDDLNDKIIIPSAERLKLTITNNKDLPLDNNTQIWSRVIFERYAYNFKSKKFTCTGVQYSAITGRIISLTFAEI